MVCCVLVLGACACSREARGAASLFPELNERPEERPTTISAGPPVPLHSPLSTGASHLSISTCCPQSALHIVSKSLVSSRPKTNAPRIGGIGNPRKTIITRGCVVRRGDAAGCRWVTRDRDAARRALPPHALEILSSISAGAAGAATTTVRTLQRRPRQH